MTTSITHFKRDIFRQQTELRATLQQFLGEGRSALAQAAEQTSTSPRVFLTGIGASWCAATGAAAVFASRGFPVYAIEAAELLYGADIPSNSVVIIISRSGRSSEIVQLCAKVQGGGSAVIGITNVADSPLAKASSPAIVIPIQLDFAISVNTYSTLLLGALALASFDSPDFEKSCSGLLIALGALDQNIASWEGALAASSWLEPAKSFYFLARGTSVASCFESRLLWEEGAKHPATAMTSSGFRHGPQETVVPGMRFCMWIDPLTMREEDLAVADDLRTLGASVALIGQNLPEKSADVVFQIPPIDVTWQSVVDVIPMQLAAEALARLRGVDCDTFRVCSFIVENEHGLLGKNHPLKSNGGSVGRKND